jgi:hypothetical protein
MTDDLEIYPELRDARAFTKRLWIAESTLEGLGYVRGKDGKWRKRISAAEVAEMQRIRAAGKGEW